MFIKRNKNRSGTYSIQVLMKIGRSNRLMKTFGTSRDEEELRRWEADAREWIDGQDGGRLFGYGAEDARSEEAIDIPFSSIYQDDLTLVGPDLVYGRLFDKIGYDRIKTRNNMLFKSLVVTRLYMPGSKLRTVEYLTYFMNRRYEAQTIYRFMDEMCYRREDGMTEEEMEAAERKSVKYQVEQITYDRTKAVLGGEVAVVFYDTTTLYFESEEDDLRVPGWSKDGKNSNPQVILGLLVAPGGNPIGYEIHKGNKYEGDTMIPIIRKFQKRFGFGKPIVVADAGLLSRKNVAALEEDGYEYILGAKIRTLKAGLQEEILSWGLRNGEVRSRELGHGRRLVVSMSDARARKSAADRERGIKRLEERFKSDKITKENLNNRGYNRLLTLEGEASVRIDPSKVEYDRKYDGLKGYTTNCHLSDKEIIENYRCLFMIEKAFSMNKTDLRIRPIYHRLHNRIEAHVCICFTAYTIMLELNRILKAAGSKITEERARTLTKKIYQLRYYNTAIKKTKAVILKIREGSDAKELIDIVSAACGSEI